MRKSVDHSSHTLEIRTSSKEWHGGEKTTVLIKERLNRIYKEPVQQRKRIIKG